MNNRFANTVALVTGASRGIGYYLARELGQGGAQILALARTVGGLQQLDDEIQGLGGLPPALIPADLANLPALDALPGIIDQRFGRLDLLVLNAAHGAALMPLTDVQGATLAQMMTINYLAPYRLLQLLTPLLLRSEKPKIIYVHDPVADEAPAYGSAYAASKAAVLTALKCYVAEQSHTALEIQIATPSPTATALRDLSWPGEDKTKLSSPQQATQYILNDI